MKTPRSPASASADCRCVCGSLVARVVAGGVELKCRRCKRTLVVPLAEGPPSAAESAHTGSRLAARTTA